ncbi:DUF4376 domain-containing protein [Mesorhizobium sp. M2A.F.Ca.ET.037.01.1.1]|uniref:DUF4376 domain-containing protein n=1 Tax=Mesorhizobium sp. M2A.F.Ca.ET.037.01.1.1 TaxID=2496748 RepID=UPI000FCAE87E|nr:DUF4376 domain-containing protein [Mesorhizobium sp. M2A.F.Ca.ET.037.01.1.1]RUX09544.1 DUF4376 domain-containing protein [Mesorhizobium sp. M2A.F.Ca.ET.037.01.1.1]
MSNDIFLVTNEAGLRYTQGHPDWLTGDTPETSRRLTADELVAAGYGLKLIDEPPTFDARKQACAVAPIDQWEVTETTATVKYVVTDLPFETVRDLKLAALADKRWSVETGGIAINGAPVRTDANSQAKITGAVSLFQNDPSLEAIDWEAQPGIWVTLDTATMKAIGIAVGRHVQACFSRARALSASIMAASDIEALDAVDIEADWPGQ